MLHVTSLSPRTMPRGEAREHRRGHTLVELLAAVVGFSIIGAAVLSVTMTMYKALSMVRAKAVVSDNLRTAMEQIGRDAQAAKGALTTGTPCGFTPSSTLLILDRADGGRTAYQCLNGSCNTGTPGELWVIRRDSACNPIPTVPNHMVMERVTSLTFDPTKDSGRRVEVTLARRRTEGNYTYDAATASSTLTSTFRWRGH